MSASKQIGHKKETAKRKKVALPIQVKRMYDKEISIECIAKELSLPLRDVREYISWYERDRLALF